MRDDEWKENYQIEISGNVYDLNHLKDFNKVFQIEISNLMVNLNIHFMFTNHCFSASEEFSTQHIFKIFDGKKLRYFCPKRYEDSKLIQNVLIDNFTEHNIYATNNANYLRILDDFHIYFRCEKKQGKHIDVRIETGHYKEEYDKSISRGKPMKMSFFLKKVYAPRSK